MQKHTDKHARIVKVIAVSARDAAQLDKYLTAYRIETVELEGFFDVEGFSTLAEVDAWWKDRTAVADESVGAKGAGE